MTLDDVVDGLDVEENFAFLPKVILQTDGTSLQVTHCNGYANAVTAALGCPIPPKLANKQHAWLKAEGVRQGWVPCNEQAAASFVERDYTVVAVWTNPTGGPGHIAACVPTPEGEEGLWVTSAGKRNHRRCQIEKSFGSLEAEFFVFQPGEDHGAD